MKWQKRVGRKNIVDFSSQCAKNNDKFLIRINETKSKEFQKDLSLISTINIIGVVLPKAQSYEDIDMLSQFELPIIPIIESALGVENLDDIARHPNVLALSFGSLDMTLDLNLQEGEGKNFILNSIRTQIILKSTKYNLLSPINGVYPDIKNIDGLKEDLIFAKSMGFFLGGGLCAFIQTKLHQLMKFLAHRPSKLHGQKKFYHLGKIAMILFLTTME